MYEHYYHLNEKPFGLTPDPKFRYPSETLVTALDCLQTAIAGDECFAVVTGDAGTGKTTLCRALVDQSGKRAVIVLLLNPPQSEEDLLKEVLSEFGIVSRGDAYFATSPSRHEMMTTLRDFLRSLVSLGTRPVLVIDEAQNMPVPVLDQVRLLANLTAEKQILLQVVLAGQTALTEVLRAPELRHLDQRFSLRLDLQPLSEGETSAYVLHRLDVAGPSRTVRFTPEALTQVHRWSGGVPRVINLLTHRALLGGYSADADTIDVDVVSAAAADLDLTEAGTQRKHVSGLWSLVSGLRRPRKQTKD